ADADVHRQGAGDGCDAGHTTEVGEWSRVDGCRGVPVEERAHVGPRGEPCGALAEVLPRGGVPGGDDDTTGCEGDDEDRRGVADEPPRDLAHGVCGPQLPG